MQLLYTKNNLTLKWSLNNKNSLPQSAACEIMYIKYIYFKIIFQILISSDVRLLAEGDFF